jgi:DNA (cytosine-5)-methyltransferase 1
MTYSEYIDLVLKPDPLPRYLAVDLFAGCGGMSMGFEALGFETIGYEKSQDACDSYNANLTGLCNQANLTPHIQFPKADVVIAGPPCQPFSVNGNQLGMEDVRNGFPICIAAIEQISPQVFVLENVKGLLGKNRWYLNAVIEQLQSLDYFVTTSLLNAKDYQVPQNRERVFIIGSKNRPLQIGSNPRNTITAGQALNGLSLEISGNSKILTPVMERYIKKYEIASKCRVSRDLHLDRPSRTLTCRNLGGSTGDMLRLQLSNGQRRRLNISESARLQSFPNWFSFKGGENSVFKQIGNAVPPMMSYHIAKIVKEALEE